MICYSCGKETGFKEFVGRGDVCPHCRRDARVCKNCQFYDPKVYNECREPSAERVVEKEKFKDEDLFVGRCRRRRHPRPPLKHYLRRSKLRDWIFWGIYGASQYIGNIQRAY